MFSGIQCPHPVAEGHLPGGLLDVVRRDGVLLGVVLPQADALIRPLNKLTGQAVAGGNGIIQHGLVGLNPIQLAEDAAKLRDNQIHTDLLLKQIIRPVRPAKLTASAGFQVFADGAHRHKVPVLAVQQALVVCLPEQLPGIRQLLLLLGNQLVIISRKPEGLLIGVLLVLNVDGILRQRLLIFFFAVISCLLRIYRCP